MIQEKSIGRQRDPTSRADANAARMRTWYEDNRERWWQRIGPNRDRSGWHADEFMLRLMAEAKRIWEGNESDHR